MANPIGSQYYYLKGRPAICEEWLMQPSRLGEKWRIDAWHAYKDEPRYERLGKGIACLFLNVLGLPLQAMAALIHLVYREKIRPEEWTKNHDYWSKIIVSAQDDQKNYLISALIKMRITHTIYGCIFHAQKQPELINRQYFADGLYSLDEFNHIVQEGKKCLFLIHSSRAARRQLPKNPLEFPRENGIPHPDQKSGLLKGRIIRTCQGVPTQFDCLLLLTKNLIYGEGTFEDPRLQRRLLEVLLPTIK